MINGQITLNGIFEKQLAHVLDFKTSHEGQFNFNGGGTQQKAGAVPQMGSNYNNVTITWDNDQGLKTVLELVLSLVSASSLR